MLQGFFRLDVFKKEVKYKRIINIESYYGTTGMDRQGEIDPKKEHIFLYGPLFEAT